MVKYFKMAQLIWTTFGYLHDVIFRQYFKGAYDIVTITMATVQLSERAFKTQFLLIILKIINWWPISFSLILESTTKHQNSV